MAILTAGEAANVLRCEVTDADMLALLPIVDAYVKNASGRDWALDATIYPEAKSAARILLVRLHEDPGALAAGSALGFGLQAVLIQLKTKAMELAEAGVPNEALAIAASMPTDGADEVAVAASLTVIFNHAMGAGATAAAALATAAGAAVATTNALDVTQKILTVNPDSNLAADTSYVLTITAAADVYGMTISETISFRTA
jgi:hypothetical protein